MAPDPYAFPDLDLDTLLAAIPERLAGDVALGVTGTCPDCFLTVVCAGQVDSDPVVDVWSVSTVDRTAPDGTVIPAGEPFAEVNDLLD